MLIVVDENIPLAEAFFEGFGQVRRVPGRTLSAEAVRDADALLVRSVTRVNPALLEGSAVRFVGTCTIGTDHLDLPWLESAGIRWASAPGCNARGVVDYVLGSLFTLAELDGVALPGRRYGIVGAGQVGGRLARVLRGLGWDVRVCDPPRQALEEGDYCSLEEIIEQCDVISLHTPLTRTGPQATWHLFDRQRLERLRTGAWLINAARGPVIDNQALKAVLNQRDDLQAVLDVWEEEPRVDLDLARLCVIATPHIAGYSLDGRQRGTEAIYQAFCAWQGQRPSLSLETLLPAPWLARVDMHGDADPAWALAMLCRGVYDPRRDDADFRRSLDVDETRQRAAFDALRKAYPVRREITGLKVRVEGQAPLLRRYVQGLGATLLD
ncbi:4-phosphoerythronate dehydrogenase PdxB [Pseudomonas massiliensis]|uniref:4-phosphoerythronate dehydrogenase PdxB n=1 Tax=Pseudomonas massiliensis TaxID=522492 RepID=UPI00058D4C77|nr:4-phosphoerythronate dehydrogenase PdxB [Pseudomonas massiliensis]